MQNHQQPHEVISAKGGSYFAAPSRLLWWDLPIMKNIDIKSIIIGALLTSTIFLGVAATGTTDKWDDKQQWEFRDWKRTDIPAGWEPLRLTADGISRVWCRRRIK